MIRIAKIEEVGALVELGKDAHEDSGKTGFNRGKALLYIEALLSRSLDDVCPLVSQLDDQVAGFLIGTKVEDNFSDRVIGVENHWFMRKQFRKSREGLQLLDAFVYWCNITGCQEVLVSNGGSPKISNLLKRQKFNPDITIFKKEF